MLCAMVSTRAAAATSAPLRIQTLGRSLRRVHAVAQSVHEGLSHATFQGLCVPKNTAHTAIQGPVVSVTHAVVQGPGASEHERVIARLSTATDPRTRALRAVRRELATHLNGYQVDLELLDQALTHRGYLNGTGPSNRKLEWLGDACLQSVATDEVFNEFQVLDVGDMAYLRSMVTCNAALVGPARSLRLGEAMLIGAGGRASIKNSETVLSDAMEAVIGAVYADYGSDESAIQGRARSRARARRLVKLMLSAYLEETSKKLSANPLMLADIPKHVGKLGFARLRWPCAAGGHGAKDLSLPELAEPQPDTVAVAAPLQDYPAALKSFEKGLFLASLHEWTQACRATIEFGSAEQRSSVASAHINHLPIFKVEVRVGRLGEEPNAYVGVGRSLKAARTAAAREACKAVMPAATCAQDSDTEIFLW
ncbi:hypothetical protein T492DRAFT_1031168 [Pavlovales sp. CCMP2436]|nr:hypothetical protein T492DRAFT_1031168 [Pavlovales sp. CCMP2436]